MKLDRQRNLLICDGEEYPPTQYNAEIYREYINTDKPDKKAVLKGTLSKVSLDI